MIECEIHKIPKSTECESCGTMLCPKCAEFVEGLWLCSRCAERERMLSIRISSARDPWLEVLIHRDWIEEETPEQVGIK